MNFAHIVPVVLLLSWCAASAQDPPAGTAPAAKPAGQDPAKKPDAKAKGTFSAEQLEQIVAPIALYSDALLAQTMMAATYPIEVVQAARWVKQNATLKGEGLEKALQGQKWDPSVKGLCGVPAVLNRLNDNLDWTQDLGDAFLADQQAVMEAVQKMRRKALEAGNLKTTKEQKVTDREDKMIVVESADPQVVYVPTYYPTVVYGSSWYYPSYYYPPMYAPCPPGYPAFTFMAGMVWGAAIWGGCSWGHNHCETNINVNNYNNFVDRTESGDRRAQAKQNGAGGNLKHSPEHRQGVRYRDQATAQRVGAGTSDRSARDQARGYGSANRPSTQPAGGAANRPTTQPGGGAATRPTTQPGGGAANRPSTQPAGGAKPAARPANTGQRSGSFNGSSSAGSTRAASSRGSASRGGGGGRGGGGRR